MCELVVREVRRGGRRVLAPHTIALPDGGNAGVVGVNGAGKSTLFQALAGLLRQRAGSVRLQPTAAAVGYAPQQPAFPEWLRVERVARLYGQRLAALEAQFPGLLLEELRERRTGALSAGQRQALAVALALARDAPLTLLDEPFAALDFRRRVGLVQALQPRRQASRLTLISSQATAELLDTCDWILVLREGVCVHGGPVAVLTGGEAGTAAAKGRFEAMLLALLDGEPPGSALRAAPLRRIERSETVEPFGERTRRL